MSDRRGDRGRHQARKRAVDLLFEAEARGLTPAEIADGRATLAEGDSEVSTLNPYTVTVARGVTEHAAHIDDLISAHLQGWTLERLPAVDRAVLRVAVWELLHADDVPEPVAVDEAVELAKSLSTDESPGFVNGVLGQVMLVTPQIRAAAAAVRDPCGAPVRGTVMSARAKVRRHDGRTADWAPYSTVEEAARVYLRDPEMALDQLRSLVDFAAIKSFIMSRGWSRDVGEADGRRSSSPTGVASSCGARTTSWRLEQGVLQPPSASGHAGADDFAVDHHRGHDHSRVRGDRRRLAQRSRARLGRTQLFRRGTRRQVRAPLDPAPATASDARSRRVIRRPRDGAAARCSSAGCCRTRS